MLRSGQKKVTVNCLDIAKIINSYKASDTIVVKMDIEGAEWDLILDFVKKDALKLIDHIAVEFHGGSMLPFQSPQDVYVKLIQLFGVKFLPWAK